MSHVSTVSAIVLSTLLLISCSSERSVAPVLSDGENPDTAEPTVIGQSQA
ncbi:MAG: PBP1b-binding outer membrane lipoprotein LpoB, partial [Granulosicoccus sp.]